MTCVGRGSRRVCSADSRVRERCQPLKGAHRTLRDALGEVANASVSDYSDGTRPTQPNDLRALKGLPSTGYIDMATTEHTINDAIAEVLRGTRRAWRDSDIVSSENTQQIKGSAARPDILVLERSVSPVVIETEVLPAVTVEAEAVARLGAKLKQTGRTILSSVAVRLPLRLRDKSGKALQTDLLGSADLEMCLYTGSDPGKQTRWPKSGWIVGTIADLSILTRSATVPPDVIDAAVTELVNGVSEVAGRLTEIAKETRFVYNFLHGLST
jgi:hypothetical protein